MKGILFKPDMHLAIREYRKTQTRRVIKPQPLKSYLPDSDLIKRLQAIPKHTIKIRDIDDPTFTHVISAPKYQVGEVVYIKEALTRKRNNPSMPCDYITYPLDFTGVSAKNPNEKYPEYGRPSWIWERDSISPMFMPAWAARDFVEITGVRSERLQEITEEDAKAEGMTGRLYQEATGRLLTCARDVFQWYWDSINKKHPRSMNPWVFVYSFKKVDRSSGVAT